MSMLTQQIEELRQVAEACEDRDISGKICVRHLRGAADTIEALTKGKVGKWIEREDFDFEESYSGSDWTCSECGYSTRDSDLIEEAKYCPNCGSYNGGGDEK